jgi:hypothetical protein
MALIAVCGTPEPVSASWKHHQVPLQQNVTLGLTGPVRLTLELGRIECQMTTGIVLRSDLNTQGYVVSFGVDPSGGGTVTSRCKAMDGLSFCQVHELSGTNVEPFGWKFWKASATRLAVEASDIHTSLTGMFCPISTVRITPGVLLLQIESPQTFSQVLIGESVQADVNGKSETALLQGELKVEAPNANTYSI